jgi:pimeloyl-ACP methyl ester carboxylesterase/DNA-binding CsgD family transcriptional regulator
MATSAGGTVPPQDLRFCRSEDGTRLAWATHGSGPPLAIAACWLSHLQYDWQSPVWRHFLQSLGDIATTIRYDERGFGLSDWEVTDFSYESRLRDLETVLDQVPHERFALMGMSAGAPIAIGYAARHPERVSRLVLYGPIGSGCFATSEDADAEAALLAIIKTGWGRKEPLFRRVFTSVLIPDATEEQMSWLDELQRMATSPENAMASRIARAAVDVSDDLAKVKAPTLVLHARDDRAADFAWGRRISASIPNARLVCLESKNHILLGHEPAWQTWLDEVTAFLAADRDDKAIGASTNGHIPLRLSEREVEILGLASRGLDNAEIAEALTLSVRTVERHLQNVYAKSGVSGRAARTAVVARYLANH